MNKIIISLLILAFSSIASASGKQKNPNTEEAAAISACLGAMKVWEAKSEQASRAKPSSMCNMTERKKEYWDCVKKRLNKGESFTFGKERCNEMYPAKKY